MTADRTTAVGWDEFAKAAPELAEAGARLFREYEVAFLATTGTRGLPHIAPVCPIFAAGGLYLSVGSETPKRVDLEERRRYALHAALGQSDEEFQIAGPATRIEDPDHLARVHDAITFQFERAHPVFRLDVQRCLWGYWENAGRPGTRPIRRRWVAP